MDGYENTMEEVMEEDAFVENEQEETEVENASEDEKEFAISIIKAGKWSKKQVISLIDFSSLEGTISTIFKITAIAAIIALIKKSK